MKNYIKITYVDDNGIHHHAIKENLNPHKAANASQREEIIFSSAQATQALVEHLKRKH